MPKKIENLMAVNPPTSDMFDAIMGAAAAIEHAQDEAARVGKPNLLIVGQRDGVSVASLLRDAKLVERPRLFFDTESIYRPDRLVEVDMAAVEERVLHFLRPKNRFHVPMQMHVVKNRTDNVQVDYWSGLNGKLVFHPDAPALAEDGDQDDIKDSVVESLEFDLARTADGITTLLGEYSIKTHTREIKVVNRQISLQCKTERPYDQLNGIMTNMHVRRVMVGVVFVHIEISPQGMSKVDDGTPIENAYRRYCFQDGKLENDQPSHWSRGMTYQEGEHVNIGNGLRFVARDPAVETRYVMRGTTTGRMNANGRVYDSACWGRIAPA